MSWRGRREKLEEASTRNREKIKHEFTCRQLMRLKLNCSKVVSRDFEELRKQVVYGT